MPPGPEGRATRREGIGRADPDEDAPEQLCRSCRWKGSGSASHDCGAVVIKATPANVEALISADAETFWDEWRGRWVGVRLDRVQLPALRELIVDAWRIVAPQKLIAELPDQ